MFRFGDPGGRMYTSVGSSNVNFLSHWTNIVGGTLSVNSGTGRTTGSSLRLVFNAGVNSGFTKTLDNRQIWGGAFAFKMSALPTSGSIPILTFLDNTSAQIGITLLTTGQIVASRNNSTVLGSSSSSLTPNVWNHLEFKSKIDSSTGTIELRLNNAAIIGPLTSQNTQNNGNSYASSITFGNYGGSNTGLTITWDFDDIIIWDSQTNDAVGNADISDFIGDSGLSWIQPSGAGNSAQYTPDSGSNYARVNETTPDGDTSYVEDSTIGHVDSYALADLPAGVTAVKSIAACHYARKTDVGGRQMGALIRTGSTNYIHPTGVDLGNSYQYSFRNWGKNPNTSSAWTTSDVNGLELGQTTNS